MNLKQLENDIEHRIETLTILLDAMKDDLNLIRQWRGVPGEVAQIADHREKKK